MPIEYLSSRFANAVVVDWLMKLSANIDHISYAHLFIFVRFPQPVAATTFATIYSAILCSWIKYSNWFK